MKRLLYVLICLFLLAPIQATAKNWTFSAHDGTIGGTTGKLDNIDQCNANGAGYDLQNKDGAIVWDQGDLSWSFYIYNSASEAAEVDGEVITPDYCDEPGAVGAGRWISADIKISSGLLQTLLDLKLTTSVLGAAYDTEAKLLALFAAKADESIVGTSLNADDLELNGAVLQTAAEIPHTDVAETVTAAWTLEGQRITVKTAAPTNPLPGWEGWADSVTWDPTGQGLSIPIKVTLTRDTAELMPNAIDRNFTGGATAWANVDLNAFDETTDLTITATAANQYCTLAVASAPTTIGTRYRMTYDLANIVSTWTLKSFDGTQTIGTISANATQGYLDWIATTTGGYRIVSTSTTSSGDFDNFTLNALPYKSIRDQGGNFYFATIQAAMKVIPDADGITLTAAQMNAVIVVTNAGEVQIPAGLCDTVSGIWVTVKQTGAYAVDIAVLDADDDIYMTDGTKVEGTTNELQTAGAAGNQITLMCIAVNEWWVTGEIGTSTSEAAD